MPSPTDSLLARLRPTVAPLRRRLRNAALDRGTRALLSLGDRVSEVVDAATSRLLEADAAAAQLAYIMESAAARHGRETVTRLVLRRNLLLDGTFLAMIEPLLAGEAAPSVDRRRLDGACATLTRLLVEIAELEVPAQLGPEDVPIPEALDWVQRRAPHYPLDAVAPYLCGHVDDPALGGFVLGSYALFLQTFLLRTVAHAAPAMAAEATALLTDSTDPV